jgi:hypothetical protein
VFVREELVTGGTDLLVRVGIGEPIGRRDAIGAANATKSTGRSKEVIEDAA